MTAPTVVTTTSTPVAIAWARAHDVPMADLVIIAPGYQTRWDHVTTSDGVHVVHLAVTTTEAPEPDPKVTAACATELARLAKLTDLDHPDTREDPAA